MLVLTRVINQRIRIRTPDGTDIWITLVETDRNKARLGVEAPREYDVQREENLYREKAKQPPPPRRGRGGRGCVMPDINERMTSWRWSWRSGIAPCLPTKGLLALRDALRDDDPRLLQGCTTTPPPLQCVQEWPVEAACAVGYAWAAELGGFATEGGERNEEAALVGPTEEMFAQTCFNADQHLGEPAACRWFLNWFDDTPRDEMRRELLPEVDAELARRAALEMVS